MTKEVIDIREIFSKGTGEKIGYWTKENGRDVPLIFGGYKKLRNYCMLTLDTIEQKKQKWIIIGGRTGSGKTKLIKKISSSIDLENIANHKGSAFGSNITSQPSTINF